MTNKTNLLLVLPVISGFLWGATGIFARNLLAFGFDPASMTFVRMCLSTILLAIILGIYDKNLLKIKKEDIGLMLGCAFSGMLGLNLCYMKAIDDLSLSLAAVLLAMAPVYVLFMAAIFFKEKLTKRTVLCTAAALGGCVLVSGMLEAGGLQWTWIGIILGLLSGICYGIYSIVSKSTMAKGYNVFTIIFYSVAVSAIALIPFTDWEITGSYLRENPVGHILFLACYSLCTSIMPYVFFTYAINHAPAGKVTLLASGGEPVAASIFGLVLFAEIPTVLSFIGLVVTIGALAIVSLPEKAKT